MPSRSSFPFILSALVKKRSSIPSQVIASVEIVDSESEISEEEIEEVISLVDTAVDIESNTSSLKSCTTAPEPLISETTASPIFSRRLSARSGVIPSISTSVPESTKSILNLATSLLAETLDLDFVYLASVDLNSSACRTTKFLEIISSHNLPIPLPLFDLELHTQPLTSSESILLFNHTNVSILIDSPFSTGLLIKVKVVGSKGYILGGFSETNGRILNQQDFLFFNNFASDISKHLSAL